MRISIIEFLTPLSSFNNSLGVPAIKYYHTQMKKIRKINDEKFQTFSTNFRRYERFKKKHLYFHKS